MTYPVKYRKHHVELFLLLLLGHVARWMAQLWEEASQVHQAERVVLGAALLLPWPPHDPFHHVHLERLRQGKGSPAGERNELIPQNFSILIPWHGIFYIFRLCLCNDFPYKGNRISDVFKKAICVDCLWFVYQIKYRDKFMAGINIFTPPPQRIADIQYI